MNLSGIHIENIIPQGFEFFLRKDLVQIDECPKLCHGVEVPGIHNTGIHLSCLQARSQHRTEGDCLLGRQITGLNGTCKINDNIFLLRIISNDLSEFPGHALGLLPAHILTGIQKIGRKDCLLRGHNGCDQVGQGRKDK